MNQRKRFMSVYYGDYLKLDQILNAQALESEKFGHKAHDEMLFIVTHQTYELWFKQILFELDSVNTLLSQTPMKAEALSIICRRAQRVVEIFKILVQQLKIMETMTPLDFMDFRDYLTPASGFQSLQFRLLETLLGFKMKDRMKEEKVFFQSRLNTNDLKKLQEQEEKLSLFESLEGWLERMPFAEMDGWDFWGEYAKEVQIMIDHDKKTILENDTLDEKTKNMELANLDRTQLSFKTLLNARDYEIIQEKGEVKLSQRAMLNALFISLYRDWPMMQLPYQFLNLLVEIDETLTSWRYYHSMMAQRLLGTKIGTGGSSGHEYLKKAAEKHRAFVDLFNLATYLLPKSKIPELPQHLKFNFTFVHDHGQL